MVSIEDASDRKSLVFEFGCTFLTIVKVFSFDINVESSFNILMILAGPGDFSVDASAFGPASRVIVGERVG